MNEVSKVTTYLYVGSMDAVKKDKLRQLGVTLVINCAREIPLMTIPGVEIIKLDVDDLPTAKIDAHFDHCSELIKATKDRGSSALVHCAAGVSRSASIVLAHLMKYHCMTLKRAYGHLKLRRPVIRPNAGFFRQLIDYEKQLYGIASVLMVRSRLGFVPDVYADETRLGICFSSPLIASPTLSLASQQDYNNMAALRAFRRWR